MVYLQLWAQRNASLYYTYPVFDLFADLEQDGFSKNPFFHAIVAEVPEEHKTKDGERMK